MLEGGIEDGFALNTYVNIMVRWGSRRGKTAAELILERAQSENDASSASDAVQPGSMQPHQPPARRPRVPHGRARVQRRRSGGGCFFAWSSPPRASRRRCLAMMRARRSSSARERLLRTVPQSKILRRVELPAEAGAEEMLRSMKSAIGMSEEREQQRARSKLSSKWRLAIAFRVASTLRAWKCAGRGASLGAGEAIDRRREEVPLEHDRRTVGAAARRVLPFEDAPVRSAHSLRARRPRTARQGFRLLPQGRNLPGDLERADENVAAVLRKHLPAAMHRCARSPQAAPRADPAARGAPSEDELHLPSSSRELQSLARTGNYVVYSDDAMLRMWILDDKFAADGMCTLDLLCGLEETGLLTAEEMAIKLAQLCDWHVGIQIQLRHQLALIPETVRLAPRVLEAAAMLRGFAPFMSLARGMWGRTRTSWASSITLEPSSGCWFQDPAGAGRRHRRLCRGLD